MSADTVAARCDVPAGPRRQAALALLAPDQRARGDALSGGARSNVELYLGLLWLNVGPEAAHVLVALPWERLDGDAAGVWTFLDAVYLVATR